MPSFQTRNWCFTIFDYSSVLSTLQELRNDTNIVHCVYQEEQCPETKKMHLQGHIIFKHPVSMKKVKKVLRSESVHLEQMKGRPIDSYKYCTKDDSHPEDGIREEFGEMPKQGKRNDILRAQELIEQGASFDEVEKECFGVTIKYKQYIESAIRKKSTQKLKESIIEKYSEVEWKPFQQEIIDICSGEPDKRKVYWYYEEDGNTGKSFLTRYMIAKENAVLFTGGKVQDILYAYNNERVIIFDLPRTYADNLDHIYTCIENFKNGQYLSTKYNSEMRIFEIPHIIVFSNYMPDESKLSADRYNIRNIKSTQKYSEVNKGNTIPCSPIVGSETLSQPWHFTYNKATRSGVPDVGEIKRKDLSYSEKCALYHKLMYEACDTNKSTQK